MIESEVFRRILIYNMATFYIRLYMGQANYHNTMEYAKIMYQRVCLQHITTNVHIVHIRNLLTQTIPLFSTNFDMFSSFIK